MLPVSAMPEIENGAGNKDGGESTRKDSDHKNKGEIIDDSGTKNPEGCSR